MPDYQTAPVLKGIFVLLLHLGRTTRQRNIPFGYLHHLLAQGNLGRLVCFLQPSYLKKLMA
jgi:hypothetical protein